MSLFINCKSFPYIISEPGILQVLCHVNFIVYSSKENSCKVVALATRTDSEEVCGVAQLCSGLWTGMEGAIHAVCELFDLHSGDDWGVLPFLTNFINL